MTVFSRNPWKSNIIHEKIHEKKEVVDSYVDLLFYI